MTKANSTVGIIGVATSLPKKIITSADVSKLSGIDELTILQKLGFKQKRVAIDTEHPSEFALKAARKIIRKSGIKPDNIDYIIYSGNGIFDYQFWSPSAYLQSKLKAQNAMAFEMNNGCNAAISALHLAENLLMNNKSKYALVVASDTLSRFVDYNDPNSFPLFSMADGAAAILLHKNHNQNRLLSYSTITDGQFVDCNKLEIGGTIEKQNGHGHIDVDYNHKKTKLLRDKSMIQNYVNVIKQSLKSAHLKNDDVSKLCITQNSLSIINGVASSLGLTNNVICSTREKFGHIGAIDSVFAFEMLCRNGKVKKGDKVILASTGIGYHWSSLLIRV